MIFPCGLIVLIILGYPVLQGYALFRLRDWLRRVAWAILILVVPFCLLCVGSVLFDGDTRAGGGIPGKGLIQAAFLSWPAR